MSNCTTIEETCENDPTCCPVENSVEKVFCPVDESAKMGSHAFFQAMKEAQVEIIKEKIKKAWGDKLDKKADAVVKAMGTHWQTLLDQAKAQKDLRDDIQKIYYS